MIYDSAPWQPRHVRWVYKDTIYILSASDMTSLPGRYRLKNSIVWYGMVALYGVACRRMPMPRCKSRSAKGPQACIYAYMHDAMTDGCEG